MTGLLLILACGISFEVLLALHISKYVRFIAACVFSCGVLLAFLCVRWPWISAIYSMCCVGLCFYRFRKAKAAAALIVSMVTVALLVIPGCRELLYLDLRYADHFTYVSPGVCHSAVLDCDVLVDLDMGDTYQSALYARAAISACTSRLPRGTTVEYASLEQQQTVYLATSFDDYVRVMNPTVYIGVRQKDSSASIPHFPIHCVLEFIS